VCVAFRTELFNDTGSTVVSYDVVKKLLHENPFKSGTNHPLKGAAFVLTVKTIIRTDDQVTRLWVVFMRSSTVVRRNPQSGQAGNWLISLT
jgi:hypothetical protein